MAVPNEPRHSFKNWFVNRFRFWVTFYWGAADQAKFSIHGANRFDVRGMYGVSVGVTFLGFMTFTQERQG